MKHTKNAREMLFLNVVSLLLCVAMLCGWTMAWFTDTINVRGDLTAGSVEVALQKYIDGQYKNIGVKEGNSIYTEDANPIFSGTNWKPGKTEFYYLAVANEGSMPLYYDMVIDVSGGLAPAIEYAIFDGVQAGSAEAGLLEASKDDWAALKAVDGVQLGTLSEGRVNACPNGHLQLQDVDYFVLALHMNVDAGAEFEGTSLSADVELNAYQVDYEVPDETIPPETEPTPSEPIPSEPVEPAEDPFADWETQILYDFEEEMTIAWGQPICSGGSGATYTITDGSLFMTRPAQTDGGFPDFRVAMAGLWYDNRASYTQDNSKLRTADEVVYEVDMKVGAGSWASISLAEGTELGSIALKTDGKLYVGGEAIGTITHDKWFHFAMHVDYVDLVVSYYLDNVKIGEQAIDPNSVATRRPDELRFHVSGYGADSSQHNNAISFEFDNFKAKVAPAG